MPAQENKARQGKKSKNKNKYVIVLPLLSYFISVQANASRFCKRYISRIQRHSFAESPYV